MAELTNAIQKFFVENSRLGIPVIFHEECLHGHAAIGGTSFPQPIALGASFDPELVESLFTMTALEARLRGAHQALTPVVDVARDPRWGRVEETYGEDPYVASRMGIAAVRGFQGDASFRDKTRVIATLKHMTGHGQPESGMNCAPADISERVLRGTFLFPFEQALHKAGAISVMASYNEVDGVPSHANRWLLRDILRKEWGFKGFVVSDYYAIWELGYRPDTHGHFVAKDKKESCVLAVRAGINIELPEPDCYLHLVELVRKGVLKEKRARRAGRTHAALEVPHGPVRRSVRGPGGSGSRGGLRRAPCAGTRGGARGRLPCSRTKAAWRRSTERGKDDRGDRPQRQPQPAGRLQRQAQSEVTVLEGIRAKAGKRVKGAL